MKRNFKGTDIANVSIRDESRIMTIVMEIIDVDQGRLRQFSTHVILVLLSSFYLGGCNFNDSPGDHRSIDYYRSIHARCSSAALGVTAPNSDTICIKGKLRYSSARKFDELSKNMELKYLVLESTLGFNAPAMDIGDMIANKDITAIVDGICGISSQFIFIAAEYKVILPGGGLVFGNGPISEERLFEMNLNEKQRENLLQKQVRYREFYADRGINLDLITNPPTSARTWSINGEIVFWSWNQTELESFGVTNVTQYSVQPIR